MKAMRLATEEKRELSNQKTRILIDVFAKNTNSALIVIVHTI